MRSVHRQCCPMSMSCISVSRIRRILFFYCLDGLLIQVFFTWRGWRGTANERFIKLDKMIIINKNMKVKKRKKKFFFFFFFKNKRPSRFHLNRVFLSPNALCAVDKAVVDRKTWTRSFILPHIVKANEIIMVTLDQPRDQSRRPSSGVSVLGLPSRSNNPNSSRDP